MTIYARITPEGSVDQLIELTAQQYASLQVNGKSSFLRLWIVDPQPTPSPSQVVMRGPITVGATEARQTWTLRDKTSAELEREQYLADLPTLRALLSAITADIQAYNPTPDVSGTAVERLAKLESRVLDVERQQRRINLIDRHYLRGLA